MKTTCTLITVLVLAGTLALQAQEYRGIAFGIEVGTAGGQSEYLVMGVREGASSGIDNLHQEFELPPFPPSEIFDVRFIGTPGESDLGSGSLNDYRGMPSTTGTFTMRYTVSYQAGVNASAVTVKWDTPVQSRVLSCTIEGENISGMTEYTTEFAQGQFVVEVTMTNTPLVLTADPTSLSFSVTGDNLSPEKPVQLTCENDKGAVWEVTTDADWILVNPNSGNGDATLMVQINPIDRPDGTYSGTITVFARLYNVSVDIPVTLVSTDVPAVPSAQAVWLGQNYPNPFGAQSGAAASTTIPLAFAGVDRSATLLVFDVYGRIVADLTPALRNTSGVQYIEYTGAGLPPGMYWYKLTANGLTRTRTLLLMR